MSASRFLIIPAVAAALATTACAPHPNRIEPLEISAQDFSPLSCEELRVDIDRNTRLLEASARNQREARALDAMGWATLFFPPTLISGDNRANVAVAKGTDIALRGAYEDKHCAQ